jgi:hypothetical protein
MKLASAASKITRLIRRIGDAPGVVIRSARTGEPAERARAERSYFSPWSGKQSTLRQACKKANREAANIREMPFHQPKNDQRYLPLFSNL